MDIGHQEFHPGTPGGGENLVAEYPLSFRGKNGIIRTKTERLAGGSTSDVKKGIFNLEGSNDSKAIAFKVYNPEPLGTASDAPWRVGPAEAAILSSDIPGVAQVYDYGWLHGGTDGKSLDATLNPNGTTIDISPRGVLPSQFAIAVEYLDPEQNIHPEELWRLVKEGLLIDPVSLATAEGAKRVTELMSRHDLMKKGYVYPQEFAENILVSAAWTYFNTKAEL